ncbi:MAG: acyl-CoA dehydrogenase family protein, partial [Burkholderiales bacterium]|nr:acyl-CoA dehydrogenase family protein [Burkholderiales bacterium]
MSSYAAPLKDMQFAIAEFAGLEGIAALPGCAEVTGELVGAVLTEAGKFAQGVLDPLNRSGDRQG